MWLARLKDISYLDRQECVLHKFRLQPNFNQMPFDSDEGVTGGNNSEESSQSDDMVSEKTNEELESDCVVGHIFDDGEILGMI